MSKNNNKQSFKTLCKTCMRADICFERFVSDRVTSCQDYKEKVYVTAERIRNKRR